MVGSVLDITSKNDRKAIILLLLTVSTLTAIHYYHQIKISKLKIEQLEKINKDLEELKAKQNTESDSGS